MITSDSIEKLNELLETLTIFTSQDMPNLFAFALISIILLFIFTLSFGILMLYIRTKGKLITRKRRKQLVRVYYCFSKLYLIAALLLLSAPIGFFIFVIGRLLINCISVFGVNIKLLEYLGLVILLIILPSIIRIVARWLLRSSEEFDSSIKEVAWKEYNILKFVNSKITKISINIFYAICIFIYSVDTVLAGSIGVGGAPIYLAILTFLALDKTGIIDRLQAFIPLESSLENRKIIEIINRDRLISFAYYIRKGEFPNSNSL